MASMYAIHEHCSVQLLLQHKIACMHSSEGDGSCTLLQCCCVKWRLGIRLFLQAGICLQELLQQLFSLTCLLAYFQPWPNIRL